MGRADRQHHARVGDHGGAVLGLPAEEHRAIEDRVLAQDIAIVNSQRPEWLPLDLQAERHVGSDRIGVAYRNRLRKLVVVYGTDATPSFDQQGA